MPRRFVEEENDDRQAVIAVIGEEERPAAGGGLLRSSGTDQQAHQDAEVVAGDVDQVAFVDVLTSSQPSPTQAAALQVVGEGSLDDRGSFSHPRLADLGAKAVAVGVDGVPRLGIAVPTKERRALRLGDPRLPDPAIEILQPRTGVVALVATSSAGTASVGAMPTSAKFAAAPAAYLRASSCRRR